ncbi:MAG: hypothetical protein GKR94_05795 [Gammaproteobacteria bacterium]|nr:hypothetical protein [Gammaproteobacteria bacterium]
MSRCLYTYADLGQGKSTVEHIVPYALGGSDAFVIRYCSKQANNDFGRDIDAPFMALPLVGFSRYSLGLKGRSGQVPDIVFNGECVELETPCKVVFPFRGEPYANFGVSPSGSLESGKICFSGSEERLRLAVKGLIKKATVKGFSLQSHTYSPILTIEDAFSEAKTESGETLHFRLHFGYEDFFVPWAKGIVKIALGFGAFALGETWAFSPAADALRSALMCGPRGTS